MYFYICNKYVCNIYVIKYYMLVCTEYEMTILLGVQYKVSAPGYSKRREISYTVAMTRIMSLYRIIMHSLKSGMEFSIFTTLLRPN